MPAVAHDLLATPAAPAAPACAPGAAPMSCLPARSADVVAFPAAECSRSLSMGTVDGRRAATRYLRFAAGMDRGVHPTRLKRPGRHKSRAVPGDCARGGAVDRLLPGHAVGPGVTTAFATATAGHRI